MSTPRSLGFLPPLGLPTSVVLAATLASGAAAQDLQPGLNFPLVENAFGAGRSENIDVADIDVDGDLDVLVANGGDGAPQTNLIYINQGGLQAGTTGTFVDETVTRFLDAVDDTSRDGDFVDVDGDGDLDIFITNRGNSIIGEVSRFYDNLGGAQAGTIGTFSESTDARWGDLVSIPAGEQLEGDGSGPWFGWSCDCDFGDLDLDGDPDLLYSTYGPNISATRDSLVFLNDGAGVFDELFPWANATADTQWHVIDVDLGDLDGDFDLDFVVASRDSQSRLFTNRLGDPMASALFQDTTKVSLVDGGLDAFPTGGGFGSTYEVELADLDGDSDLDLYFVNFDTLADQLGRNVTEPDRPVTFETWDPLVGDPSFDEYEADVIDYDADGDLDVFMGNFSGTNSLYRSTLAQSSAATMELRRTGFNGEPQEIVSFGNSGTTLDGEVADLDGDGDEDLILSNDTNLMNRVIVNALGVPDPHAPTFAQIEQVADKPLGTDARVIAQVLDNSAFYLIGLYDAVLVVSIEGGPEQTYPMRSQGGQQFVGFVPGSLEGCVQYRVEVTDLTGNVGVSSTLQFAQGVPSCVWTDVGFAKAGSTGLPTLAGAGPLSAGSQNVVTLGNAAPGATTTLVVGLAALNAPFKGGTLVPTPDVLVAGLPVDGAGTFALPFTWPAGVPSGVALYWQHWIADAGATFGLAASNALESITP